MTDQILAENTALIFSINLFLSSFLTGLIWVIQVVHYPLFREINKVDFQKYEMKHQKRITPLVAPVMVVDLLFSFLLLFTGFWTDYGFWLSIAFALNLVLFLSTILVFAPLHQKLSDIDNNGQINKLINLNYVRTFGWTMRSLILIILLGKFMVV